MAKRKFLGLQYPLAKTPRGILAQKSGIAQIKADLLQLLLTNPGERCMIPTFGTPLKKLMFEPNDPQLEVQAKKVIGDAIDMWEPRIVVDQIEVTSYFPEDSLDRNDPGEDRAYILGIRILFFDPQNISEVNELKMEMPLGGG
jgi:phage baseplate assembly protein W